MKLLVMPKNKNNVFSGEKKVKMNALSKKNAEITLLKKILILFQTYASSFEKNITHQ